MERYPPKTQAIKDDSQIVSKKQSTFTNLQLLACEKFKRIEDEKASQNFHQQIIYFRQKLSAWGSGYHTKP